ncbi:MAG: hypothetical protein MUF18_20330 [Fimbriiglobus sp.]|nr:hypothetical protein [Fimbriiglobus sp.]
MPDTPTNPPTPVASHATQQPSALTLGFLTLLTDNSGVLGGYLLTNSWGRPLEFRLSTAVQPNRVQQILYGPTLTEYLHAELIGKTLIEKTSAPPALIVTDSVAALALRNKLNVPTVAVRPEGLELSAADVLPLPHPRCSTLLLYAARDAADRTLLEGLLDRVDPAVDLAEPFSRIREAVNEARRMGVTNRAA